MTTPGQRHDHLLGAAPGAHQPALLREVTAVLQPRDGAVYVDGTFGAGGYSRALLESARCIVWGIDRDPAVASGAEALAREFPDRLLFIAGRFGDMDRLLAQRGVDHVDGVALDIGVSSMQIDDPLRGFSFQGDGPLDMRMEPHGPSAADVVNGTDEEALAGLIYDLGEERRSRRVARAIVDARRDNPITRTAELASIVRRVVRPAADGLDPATRTFQALRIYVNDELGELDRGLAAAERLLATGGRLAVVSFHSLEDRRVKRFLAARAGRAPRSSRHAPVESEAPAPSFELITRTPVRPKADESAANPRARSARLRAACRLDAPAWESAA
jgi:16S rRNA (cytosine1402-N4)-methyltransferase